MELQVLARMIIGAGVVLVVIGLLLLAAGHFSLPVGRLPGDIRIERPNFRFYFPIGTSILLSVLLTAIMYLISRFR